MKINAHRLLVAVMMTLVLHACGQNSKQIPNDNQQTPIQKGVVIAKIKCNVDTTQSYAVYLPTNYSTDKKLPIIYFFDPHATGSYPLNLYKTLAEKYGYILVGSNNSKNGIDNNILNDIVKNLFMDTQTKIVFDDTKIYTSGFSGGAKVAGLICSSNTNIKGDIGCGAAFPMPNDISSLKFDYIGFAGNADFNLIEMKQLDRELNGKPINHKLVVFEGSHQWPPAAVFEEAFIWLQNPQTINSEPVSKDVEVKEYLELQKMQYYSGNLNIKDVDWWKETVAKLNTDIKESKDKEEVLKSKRILNYLSLAAYMVASGVLNSGDMEKAKKQLEIYSIIDPENSEAPYLLAEVYSKEGNTKKAIKSLKEALKLGFNDYERISKDAVFTTLKENKDYIDILEKVKNKK